jgi:hypothetical protein
MVGQTTQERSAWLTIVKKRRASYSVAWKVPLASRAPRAGPSTPRAAGPSHRSGSIDVAICCRCRLAIAGRHQPNPRPALQFFDEPCRQTGAMSFLLEHAQQDAQTRESFQLAIISDELRCKAPAMPPRARPTVLTRTALSARYGYWLSLNSQLTCRAWVGVVVAREHPGSRRLVMVGQFRASVWTRGGHSSC